MRAPFQSQLHTVILVTCLASGGFIPQALPADTTGAGSDENRTVALYERLAPATVSLSVTYPSGGLGAGTTHVGVGAGFIVDEQGTILTNAHVVEGASVITASLFNGARVNIALLAIDPTTDVAILRLPPGHAPVPSVMLGDSDAVRVGDVTSELRAVIQCDETPHQALERMEMIGSRHLPVVDGDRWVGMLSMRDLLRVEVGEQGDEIKLLHEYIQH